MRICLLAVASLCLAASPPAPRLVEAAASPLNDYNYGTDAKGRIAVFARSEADFVNARILVAEKAGGRWSAPTPIDFTDQRYSDSDPWLTPDGRTLYFVSNRPLAGSTPKADLDIWRSTRANGRWSQPEHLAAVSSPGPELGVELHGDTLYFSSARKGGKGGLDIYTARRDGARSPRRCCWRGRSTGRRATATSPLAATAGSRPGGARSAARGCFMSPAATPRAGPPPRCFRTASIRGEFNFTPSFTQDGRHLTFASTVARPGQPAGMADVYIAELPVATVSASR